jgi:glutathione-regulated potassium-efflux system ancillary protein KefC
MDWLAIALSDVAWISIAFVLGLLSRAIGLPPLVGFLGAGFILNAYGIASGEMLEKLSDLGITLLLFTVGLKLDVRTLRRPHVWAVTGLHSSIVVIVFSLIIYALVLIGVPFISDLNFTQTLLVAFALSFSSTVFVVKALEEKGEMASFHGRIAIGILIMQDILAVIFLAISTGKAPSVWAVFIILIIPLRPVLHLLLRHVGHGELLVLYGFLLALGGAEVFELVGLKGDLGALILGVLIANNSKADELAKSMLGFKDLFLLGFFLSIGLSGRLTLETIGIGILLIPLVFFKSALFFGLLTQFKLRSRTSLLTSFNLTNFSEFGLIVISIGVTNGWIDSQWLISIGVALSISFVIAAWLNSSSHKLYTQHRTRWKRYQKEDLLVEDRPLDIENAKIAVIGMGGIGTGTYDKMVELHGETVVGIDIDPVTVENQQSTGRNVLLGDPGDADFWDRVQVTHNLETVMLALPKLTTNLSILGQLKSISFKGRVAATAKFPDEEEQLAKAGATAIFNVYVEAGAGFAAHVVAQENLAQRDSL